jgi:hypothetical protein
MENETLSHKTSHLLGIFIFYQDPDKSYWNTLRSFLNLSLGLKYNDIFKYSISDYRQDIGYLDIISLILDDMGRKKQTVYHNIIVYVENSILLSTNYHRDMFWYRLFDIFSVEYIVYIYKEQLEFDLLLFPYRVLCLNQNLMIDHTNIVQQLVNKVIILDNLNIEEFCSAIINCTDKTRLFDYLVNRYVIDDKLTELYTNFKPTNEIELFNNLKYISGTEPMDRSIIIPIFVNNLSLKLLEIIYRELKKLQKKRLLNSILI